MNRRVASSRIGGLLVLLVAHGAYAQRAELSPPIDKEFLEVMTEIHQAALEGDTQRTESLMTDNYIQTDISGHFVDKTEWLNTYARPLAKLIKSGVFHWDLYQEKDVQIRMHKDAAIVMGLLELKARGARWGEKGTWVADPDARPELILRFTRVFVRDRGKWMLAAIHNGALTPDARADKP